ncbi:acetate--CoA ligase [Methanobrevibacter filiformis]|uniref:Acetate--CoA ligase n=1 Tax=Methanobrevibacter filiformis TaxID=55758 RepID=A0A166DB54_9EURY|nr:acetate--CoA ligase [Methanobrevibacter filiformis]KZX15400.1 acetyl-coenzyme A synthetase [Methanobrevibacter filiformis]
MVNINSNNQRLFHPNDEVKQRSDIKDWDLEIEKGKDIEKYWAQEAEQFDWFKKWDSILDESNKPYYKWFDGGQINLAYNAVDRWIETGKRNKIAILYINERGKEVKLTYYELYREVNKVANALLNLGIKKGDSVSMYLPMCPELIISMIACTKIGAVHSTIFSGLSSVAVVERVNDIKSKIIITADGTYRRGKIINLKSVIDEAMLQCPTVQTVVLVNHTGRYNDVADLRGNEIFYDRLIEGETDSCDCEVMESEDPLFILYTSGSTGKPKGVIHTTAGYMVGIATTFKNVFDIHDDDLWWSTGDAGWITGHSYTVYAPLLLGTTTLIYEGAPDFPDPGIWWKIIEKYGVTKFYTAPTAIRHLMRFGKKYSKLYNLDSLKILGSVGEAINFEAWKWMYEEIGKGKTPIMDTWWQTETGMHMISPIPIADLKPGSATKPLPGVQIAIVDEEGKELPPNKKGYLAITKPWPAMFRGLHNDDERFINVYWEEFPGGIYRAGDMAEIDEDGYIWIQGRSDDVLKIAGHRIGATEVESAFNSHPAVNETAVIGKEDPVKGQLIKAFLILNEGYNLDMPFKEGNRFLLREELKRHVRHALGPVAVLGEMVQVDKLPKTKSGKIMRRVLKAQEEGEDLGDISTLESD